jgi:hypothetical protein
MSKSATAILAAVLASIAAMASAFLGAYLSFHFQQEARRREASQAACANLLGFSAGTPDDAGLRGAMAKICTTTLDDGVCKQAVALGALLRLEVTAKDHGPGHYRWSEAIREFRSSVQAGMGSREFVSDDVLEAAHAVAEAAMKNAGLGKDDVDLDKETDDKLEKLVRRAQRSVAVKFAEAARTSLGY